jgi:sugar lactone lactonase YvrE
LNTLEHKELGLQGEPMDIENALTYGASQESTPHPDFMEWRGKARFPLCCFATAVVLIGLSSSAHAQDSASLPVGSIVNFGPNLQQVAGGVCRQPEGIALDGYGNLYLASNSDSATTVGHVCVLNKGGVLVDIINVPSGPGAAAIGLVGELWEGDHLYVCDQADDVAMHGRILKINPSTHEITTLFSGLTFPNGFAEDRYGNFFVTDSLLGAIYKFTAEPNSDTLWFKDASLISTNPNQPVGANDLAFSADGGYLYVDNAGNRQVLRIPVGNNGAPGQIELFADGATLDQQLGLPSPTALTFADGMQFDVKGNLYVMANLVNEVDVFAPDGSLAHRYSGTGNNALDFNASPIFEGSKLYMTNMSATDGGVNSKVSILQTPFPGIHLY